MTRPAPELLKELLRYEPETGKLFWRERANSAAWNGRWAGKEAFTCIDDQGYRCGSIFNRAYRAHRVIWAVVFGVWPEMGIDHADNDRLNNKLTNLREATGCQNMANRAVQVGAAGFRGVEQSGRGWRARIKINHKNVYLGTFDTAAEAASAYDAAAETLVGAFAKTNQSLGLYQENIQP